MFWGFLYISYWLPMMLTESQYATIKLVMKFFYIKNVPHSMIAEALLPFHTSLLTKRFIWCNEDAFYITNICC